MKERKTDLFDTIYEDGVDAICITTNGHWTTDGDAVMGGGCAGVCADRWPQTCKNLGKFLSESGGKNIPYLIGALDNAGNYLEPPQDLLDKRAYKCLVFSFPTIADLMEGAKLSLIKNSAKELKALVGRFELKGVICPRMGVGIGGLNWKNVKPVVEEFLDDRFTIVSFDHEG